MQLEGYRPIFQRDENEKEKVIKYAKLEHCKQYGRLGARINQEQITRNKKMRFLLI